MKAIMSQPESYQRVFDIEIEETEFNKAFEEKQAQYRKEIRLPGFRKGKVPAGIVKSRFGDAIRAETIEELIKTSFEKACRDNNVVPICAAKLSDLKVEEGRPVRFTIETEVDPDVDITDYHKLKVKVNPRKIKPSDVDEALNELRERLADVRDAGRPARKGDLLTIEYVKVVIDGQVRGDFTNPKYPIELGAGRIKDFDKGFEGHSAGETVQIRVKFPKDYAEAAVAGKTGEFEIKLAKVQEKVLPEVNEEFLKKVGNFADENALRQRIQADLEARELERAKNEAYNEAIDKLIKSNEIDVPPSRIEQYIDYVMEEVSKYRRNNEPALTREEVAERYRDLGIRAIKRHRIIECIAAKENIKATQEEVDARIQQISAAYNQPFEQVKQALRRNGTTERIRADIREQKTLDYLVGLREQPAS